jgi:nucleotide-binding universal stress UspA family protein
MFNPFRSEADAFRLLLGAAVYLGAIGIAALAGGFWLGLVVFIFLTLAIVVWWALAYAAPERPPQIPSAHADGERRILVVANETVGGETLQRMIEERSRETKAEIMVCTPALNSRLRHWVSDEDRARAAAQERLDASLERMRKLGIDASGEIGDADPLQAMEDALRTFGADEIIISTHPEGRSNWLERGVVEHARDRFAVPIRHVVVDLDREREEARS